jgi:hypothetical protein
MGLDRLELSTFYEARKVKFSVAGHTDPWGQFPIPLTCPSYLTILVRRLRVAASRISLPSHYLLSVSALSA